MHNYFYKDAYKREMQWKGSVALFHEVTRNHVPRTFSYYVRYIIYHIVCAYAIGGRDRR